jgi:hypothetical protein
MDRDADECPDGEVRPDEYQHGAHVSASQDCRDRARQHHRTHRVTARHSRNQIVLIVVLELVLEKVLDVWGVMWLRKCGQGVG